MPGRRPGVSLPGLLAGGGDAGRMRRVALVALCGAILAGLAVAIVIESAADHAARVRPQAALAWKPDSAEALSRQAERLLVAGEFTAARSAAKRALEHDPLEARAIRVLGEVAALEGNLASARSLIAEAGRRSRSDVPAHQWLFQQRLADGDIKGALDSLDGVVRTGDTAGGGLMTAMAVEASRPDVMPQVVERLATDPPWRYTFVRIFSAVAAPTRSVDLIAALRETRKPPTTEEYAAVINRALRDSDYNTAYYTWLMALPPAQLAQLGYVYNGTFELESAPEPFNWVLPVNRWLEAYIAVNPDRDSSALHVTYAGASAPAASVKQLLFLAPGRYRVTGLETTEAIRGDQGAHWAVQCAARGVRTMLGESRPQSAVSAWKPFSFEFEVPMQNCPAQWLVLMRSAPEAPQSSILIDAWYDDIAVRRLGPTPQ